MRKGVKIKINSYIIIIMQLAQRDLNLLQIEEEIKHKKHFLVKKKKELDKKQKLNEYLVEIKEDYTKYYDFIVNEKQKQYDSMMLLKEYLGDLIQTEGLVDSQLRVAKHDQKDILVEIEKIKSELDELTK
jgi:hypothetical protein